jgi:hypothetical protein
MANKRVSMKGRGADLFFGDYTPADVDAGDIATPTDEIVTRPSSPPVDATEDLIGSKPVALVEVPEVAAGAPVLSDKKRAEHPAASGPLPPPTSSKPPMRSSNHASKQEMDNSEEVDGTRSGLQAGEPSFEQASTLAVSVDAIDTIRRAIREPGREVAYVRLTPEEKGLVGDIVHAYKKRGQRTTENELHRIAINHLLQDHHERGEDSVLARVLASLWA